MRFFYHTLLGFMLVLLSQCGSDGDPGNKENDDPKDTAAAARVARQYYQSILDRDSAKILGFMAQDVDPYISDLLDEIKYREEYWGKLESFRVVTSEAHFDPNGKKVGRVFFVIIAATYEYNQSEDILEISKTDEGGFELFNYVLDDMLVFDCSAEKMKTLQPLFEEVVENLVNRRDEKIKKWFEPDTSFFRLSMAIRDEFFPEAITDDPIVMYHNGYLRQFCGSKKGSNAFLTYEVELNDTATRYVTLMFSTEDDDPQINLYSLKITDHDGYDLEEDQALARKLSKEIFRLLDRRDHQGFFHALHPDIQHKADGTTFNESELKEMVDFYAGFGKFIDFYEVTTVSFAMDEKNFIRYVVIARLMNEDKGEAYVELSFKPDENGKILLMGIEEM